MNRRSFVTRIVIGLVVAAVLVPPLAAPAGGSGEVLPCPDARRLPGLGLVCDGPSGLLAVHGPDGAFQGFTHGLDPAPPAEGTVSAFSAAPDPDPVACVEAAEAYHAVVIYARAHDDTADNLADPAATLRDLVERANGYVGDAAAATGGSANIRVRCEDGAIKVHHEVLPTAKAAADFSTIVADLKATGYDDGKLKYWVFYDDKEACSCGGTGHIYGDDRLTEENWNNGNGAALFAVDFGYTYESGMWGVLTMLHELSHNMGAVQKSAPHSTGAWHCTDGYDIMCYDDGGPDGADYDTTSCPDDHVYDCGQEDYFHRSPATGSYLASHWNVGGDLNRFIDFANEHPVLVHVSCDDGGEVDEPLSCGMRATDDSAHVTYDVDWGDGDTSALGPIVPGTLVTAGHAYAAAGSYSVRVTATDDGSPPRSSATLAEDLTVVLDATPPTMTILDPANGHLYRGCAIKVAALVGSPAYVDHGCVRVEVVDTRTGVDRVEVRVDGVLRATVAAPSAGNVYEATFDAGPTRLLAPVSVKAVDGAGNEVLAFLRVNVVD